MHIHIYIYIYILFSARASSPARTGSRAQLPAPRRPAPQAPAIIFQELKPFILEIKALNDNKSICLFQKLGFVFCRSARLPMPVALRRRRRLLYFSFIRLSCFSFRLYIKVLLLMKYSSVLGYISKLLFHKLSF